MIRVEHLTKHYRVHHKRPGFAGSLESLVRRRTQVVEAVRDVSFSIEAGEMVGFLGPNGAGKTTTLKMLAGLLHPTAGRVSVAGFTPQKRERAFLKAITLVMGQKMQLSWDLPAADSFLVNQAIYDIPEPVFRQRLHELSAMLGLDGLLNTQVRKLSLGERMKCELAAALLHGPRVLFLDEPTIGLDVNMQQAVRRFIADYNARYGATVLLTSHYMADVTALADRVLVIDAGELVFDGDLRRLVEREAPHKLLRLQFRQVQPAAALARYGELRRAAGLEAEIRVPRERVAEVAARLLADFPVADINIEDPPIEEIIGHIFRGRGPAEPQLVAAK
ncbi:MAG: ATP-binding cassette domain-containing protein [Rhodospirillaceae bacterium]|nr:ATP-binding cassette domain-containing protein [Rhodospirillaceae bacterium]